MCLLYTVKHDDCDMMTGGAFHLTTATNFIYGLTI